MGHVHCHAPQTWICNVTHPGENNETGLRFERIADPFLDLNELCFIVCARTIYSTKTSLGAVTIDVVLGQGGGGGREESVLDELQTLHPTPNTLHPTPYTLHPTPYTLHPTTNEFLFRT